MTGPLAVLGIVAVVLGLDVLAAAAVRRRERMSARRGHRTQAHFLGGQR